MLSVLVAVVPEVVMAAAFLFLLFKILRRELGPKPRRDGRDAGEGPKE